MKFSGGNTGGQASVAVCMGNMSVYINAVQIVMVVALSRFPRIFPFLSCDTRARDYVSGHTREGLDRGARLFIYNIMLARLRHDNHIHVLLPFLYLVWPTLITIHHENFVLEIFCAVNFSSW